MISLINHDFQWGRSEVVIIYPYIYVSMICNPIPEIWDAPGKQRFFSWISSFRIPGIPLEQKSLENVLLLKGLKYVMVMNS